MCAYVCRLYDVLVESLGTVFSARQYPLVGLFTQECADSVDTYNSLFEQLVEGASSTWSAASDMSPSENEHQRRCQQQMAEDYLFHLDVHHKDCLMSRLVQECLGWTVKSVRSSALLAR